jgi:hypothetical protein
MISIFAVLCLVVVGGPVINTSHDPVRVGDAIGLLSKMGSVVFSLGCAPATFHAYTGLKGATTKKWTNVVSYSVRIGATMCCVMGLGRSFTFLLILFLLIG